MAVPKKKSSKARRDKRRTHYKLKVPAMSICPNCGNVKSPHRVCGSCGYYKGRQILFLDEEE